MKETFTSNLSASQKEELANQKAFTELKTAKEGEIAATQVALDEKTQQLASTDEKLAQAKEDIIDTQNSLSADEKFLLDLKERCQMTDQEWEQRQKNRNEEMTAIAKAISILSSDAAHDQFSKTFNFLQARRRGHAEGQRRAKAAALLRAAAAQT